MCVIFGRIIIKTIIITQRNNNDLILRPVFFFATWQPEVFVQSENIIPYGHKLLSRETLLPPLSVLNSLTVVRARVSLSGIYISREYYLSSAKATLARPPPRPFLPRFRPHVRAPPPPRPPPPASRLLSVRFPRFGEKNRRVSRTADGHVRQTRRHLQFNRNRFCDLPSPVLCAGPNRFHPLENGDKCNNGRSSIYYSGRKPRSRSPSAPFVEVSAKSLETRTVTYATHSVVSGPFGPVRKDHFENVYVF